MDLVGPRVVPGSCSQKYEVVRMVCMGMNLRSSVTLEDLGRTGVLQCI